MDKLPPPSFMMVTDSDLAFILLAGILLGTLFGVFITWCTIKFTIRSMRKKVDAIYECMKGPSE